MNDKSIESMFEAQREALDQLFAVREEQRTFYQENVVKPGWIEGMPLPPADPLYVPNAAPSTTERRLDAVVEADAARRVPPSGWTIMSDFVPAEPEWTVQEILEREG